MDHVAIMKKEWRLLEKILNGEKTIESRWLMNRQSPWDTVKAGDLIYLKNSGEPITAKVSVEKVIQFSQINAGAAEKILNEYGEKIGIEKEDTGKFLKRFGIKNYCMLIFLKNPRPIAPFQINKNGFGTMASWISVENIDRIKA